MLSCCEPAVASDWCFFWSFVYIYAGCGWVGKDESALRKHFKSRHKEGLLGFVPLYKWEPVNSPYDDPVFDYYIAAIQHQERKKMPDVSTAIDRRALTEATASTQHVRALVCFVCAQVKVDTGNDYTHSDITLSSKNSQIICDARQRDYNSVKFNLSLPFFRETYMRGPNAAPWRGSEELNEKTWEWRRIFRFSARPNDTLEVLCCPEDVEKCNGHHDEHIICSQCHTSLPKKGKLDVA